ncbi:GIY-YIG nuclease family protein [Pedobacter xixiisoli]|uniref:Putative endonuclease n=1 Tax=Pedobacter xixiisoli TaxID=1476464 RepID=A0A286ACZ1_9SPHI|nr:GIY-YIG nuclease family protein [Pedobacter xixiisoli]SOD19745.1 putative endonuclease [Pedobacter xixiisoli]
MERGGLVYIITNKLNTVLYTGVTSDILSRILQHKNKEYSLGFTAKFNCDKLVYYCFYPTIEDAIAEEKRIKGASRLSKIKLIKSLNPEWKDLFDEINI